MGRAIATVLPLAVLLLSPPIVSAQAGAMRVTVPSPTAASLGKFGDVPVSLYTGVPDITIPLFTAQGRTLQLPITLKYHAGGIRVEEVGGWVGIGWTLEAGGVITRTVRGTVDEKAEGYYFTGQAFYQSGNWPTPPQALLQNIQDELVDGEPDQFFFSFAGRSGQFVIGPTGTSTIEYRAIPHQKLRIVPTISTNILSQFVITTEDGTQYTFAAQETTQDLGIVNGSFGANWGETHTSSWHLTEIRAPGGDAITLQYAAYVARHRMGSYWEQFDQIFSTSSPPCRPNLLEVRNETEVVAQRLASITTATHTITFTPGATLRTDALSPPPANAQQEPRLDRITVATPGGVVLRKFQLEHDYSTGRLTLKNVYEQDRNSVSLPPYTLAYDATPLPDRMSFALDHWSFYNGANNASPIPPGVAPNGTAYPGADRTPNLAWLKAGALTRITFPTGGYSEFAYEANDYGSINGAMPMEPGGTQTMSVGSWEQPSNFTLTEETVVHIVASQSPGDCWGQLQPPCPESGIVGVYGNQAEYDTRDLSLGAGTYTLYATANGGEGVAAIEVSWETAATPAPKKLAGGLRVAEIRTADAMGTITTRKYKYTLQSDPTRSSGVISFEPTYLVNFTSSSCGFFSRSAMSRMPLGGGPVVGYREVTVWHGINAEFGTTRHTFRSVLDSPDSVASSWPFLRGTRYEFKRGQESGATEYNAAGQLQQRTAEVHAFPSDSQTYRGFRGMSVYSIGAGVSLGGQWIGVAFNNAFAVISAWTFLSTDTTVVYNDAGSSSFSTARSYVFDNTTHLQLTQLTETNSTGTQRITRSRYPADYATGSGNAEAVALTAMQGSAHMHSPVIERWVVEKIGATETVVRADVTSFKTYAAGQYLPYQTFVFNNPTGVTNFAPSSVSGGFTKDSRYLLRETANTCDSYGRITQLTDPRGQVINYAYGGNPNNAFLTQVTRVGSLNLVTDVAYDTDGFVSSIKDEGGSFRYFTYDLYGRLRQIKNHAGAVVRAYGYTYSRISPSWSFNPSSPNAVIDTTFVQPGTSLVSTGYLDGLGRPIQAVVRDGTNYHVTATQYDLMGRVWRTWKPYTWTTAGYDAGFAARATDFYNAYHTPTTLAKPYVETQYTTDALSRVKKTIPEFIGTTATAFTTYTYGVDATPKQTFAEATDASGKNTRSYADIFGHGVKAILGSGVPTDSTTTLLTYNVLGQRTQATDPRGLNTTATFNTRGLLTARTSPDAGTSQSKYDKAGNLRYSQDANEAAAGLAFFTTYDGFNRPLVSGRGTATFASLDPDGTPPPLETTQGNWLVVRAYDAKPSAAVFPWTLFSAQITPLTLANVTSRLTAVASVSNGSWQVTLFSYDSDGRLATRHVFTHGNGGTTVLTALNTRDSVVRDLRDAVTQRWLTIGSNTFNHWTDYNARGQLWKAFASTTSTKPGVADVTDTYRPSGLPQTYQFQGGPSVTLRYTIREQLEMVGDPELTTYPFSARYAYHPNGTVSETDFYSAGSPAAQKRYRYVFATTSYDALNRLKSANFSGWNGNSWTNTLTHDLATINYDRAGNLTTLQRYRQTTSLIDNLTYSYPGTSNRLSAVTDAVSPTAETWDAETGSFTYDPNGNIATAPAPYSITAVSYNSQNLPVSLTRSGVTTTYRYDDAGQRITKQVGAGNTEVYIRDGATTLAVFTVNGAGTPVSWYFNVFAGDRIVGRQGNVGNRRYYHFDLLGSARSVVEGATVVESYDFEPWGLLMPGRSLLGSTKEGFTSKEQDAETGLDYFGARYYMPALGRWTAVDRFFDAYPALSPYSYVDNDPISSIDVNGDTINVAGIRAWDATFNTKHLSTLTSQLERITGLSLTVTDDGSLGYRTDEKGNAVVATDKTDKDGRPIGSATARSSLMNAISSGAGTVYAGMHTNGSVSDATQIGLDANQIQAMVAGVQGGLNPMTMGMGMHFMHELFHTTVGGGLKDPSPATFGATGPVVERVNRIRSELGPSYGQRMSYAALAFSPGGPRYLPFDKSSLARLTAALTPKMNSMFIRF